MAKARKTSGWVPALQKIGYIRILILAVIGIVGAWFALMLSVTGVTRTKNPQMALMLLPGEGTALSARADQLFFENPEQPSPAARNFAVAALRQQAINPKALRILGYFASAQNDEAKAENLMEMAQRLSRRETGTQFWLIDSAAKKNDIKQALLHYDIALKTKPDAQDILFPRLLAAIDDPTLRLALEPYIRADNDWAVSFISYANAKSENLPALASLVAKTGGVRDREMAQRQMVDLLGRLVGKSHFTEARSLFMSIPGAKSARLTSAALDSSDRNSRFGPMGWQTFDDSDAGGAFNAPEKNGTITLSVYANGSTTKTVARKLLYLKPGSYRFGSKLADLVSGDGGYLRWQILCPAGSGAPIIWSVDSGNKVAQGLIAIPASCPVQFLDLVASGGKGQTGLEATIASVSVTPAK